MIHEIDISPYSDGPDGRAAVAAAFDRAARDSGFILLVGHGVAPDLIEGALDAWQSFFDQPMEAKVPFAAPPELDGLVGYTPFGVQALAYTSGEASPPDLLEAYSVGREDTQGADYDEYRAWFPANVWPDRSVRAATEALEAELGRVAQIVLGAMSIALDLPDDWLATRCERAVVTHRANHYRRDPGVAALPDQQRLGAHTDYGVMTLLVADPVPGLEVRRGGDWIEITPPPGGIICNVGDMLSMWTNDQWVSTLHRVVPPPVGTEAGATRRSIARFLDGDPSVLIEPIPHCVPVGEAPRYPPVNAGEWLMAKIVGGQAAQPVELHAGGVTGATNR